MSKLSKKTIRLNDHGLVIDDSKLNKLQPWLKYKEEKFFNNQDTNLHYAFMDHVRDIYGDSPNPNLKLLGILDGGYFKVPYNTYLRFMVDEEGIDVGVYKPDNEDVKKSLTLEMVLKFTNSDMLNNITTTWLYPDPSALRNIGLYEAEMIANNVEVLTHRIIKFFNQVIHLKTEDMGKGVIKVLPEPKDPIVYTKTKTEIAENITVSLVHRRAWMNREVMEEDISVDKSVLFYCHNVVNLVIDNGRRDALTNIPFNDYMVLTEAYWEEEEELREQGLLLRLKRNDDGPDRIYVYQKSRGGAYILKTLLVGRNGDYAAMFGSTRKGKAFGGVAIKLLAAFTRHLLHYQRDIIECEPNSRWTQRKKGVDDYNLFSAHLVDYGKAIRKSIRPSLGGQHRSPVEHERMGHYRRYKSGKVVFVRTCTVNSGTKGRSERDYRIS